MMITVTAPTRVDLAGGTSDIYPLYLFMGGGCTVNAAVTVSSSVRFVTSAGATIRIVSEDLGESRETPSVEDLPTDGPLGLLGRAVKACPPPTGLEMTTRNTAPAGSGLGASSALLVAVVAGLMRLRGEEATPEQVVDLAADIETAAIAVPTGKQDHIAAAFGGVSLIQFGYRNYLRTSLPQGSIDRERLQSMMILTFTGEARFSGTNNWEITRSYIDGDAAVRRSLHQIRDVARDLCRTLTDGRWEDVPGLVAREWDIRRTLAPGVSTPRIDAMMAAASQAGAQASKVCGAGGGGCMLTLAPPEKRALVEAALVRAGAELIPFQIAERGLTIEQDE
jgi:D-glycero-alpha-D-manno-heptose-7-phosphate kinase